MNSIQAMAIVELVIIVGAAVLALRAIGLYLWNKLEEYGKPENER